MKIIELELSHYNLYNPVNREQLSGGEIGHNLQAKSLVGLWLDEIITDPLIKDKILKEEWEKMLREQEDELLLHLDYCDALDKFLRVFNHSGWLVFKILTGPKAGAPQSETAWFVVDTSMEIS